MGLDPEVPARETRPTLSQHVLYSMEEGSQFTATVYERPDSRDLRVLVHRLSNILTVITTNLDMLESASGVTNQRSRLSLIRNAVAAGLEALESIRTRTGAES